MKAINYSLYKIIQVNNDTKTVFMACVEGKKKNRYTNDKKTLNSIDNRID